MALCIQICVVARYKLPNFLLEVVHRFLGHPMNLLKIWGGGAKSCKTGPERDHGQGREARPSGGDGAKNCKTGLGRGQGQGREISLGPNPKAQWRGGGGVESCKTGPERGHTQGIREFLS